MQPIPHPLPELHLSTLLTTLMYALSTWMIYIVVLIMKLCTFSGCIQGHWNRDGRCGHGRTTFSSKNNYKYNVAGFWSCRSSSAALKRTLWRDSLPKTIARVSPKAVYTTYVLLPTPLVYVIIWVGRNVVHNYCQTCTIRGLLCLHTTCASLVFYLLLSHIHVYVLVVCRYNYDYKLL